jgi:hypothetical protein
MRSMPARSLTIAQVVVEDVYSQTEKRLRPVPVLYFKETKKGWSCPARTRTRCRRCSGTM